jgi:Flp pilus assembly protein TadG
MLRTISAALASATRRHSMLKRSGQRSDASSLARSESGVSAIEFAIVAPAVLTLGIGMLKFGVAMTNYMMLNNAAAQGALTLALARGTTAPYTATGTAITNAAPNLTAASITKTTAINGTACTTDTGCSASMVAGQTARVTLTYPCDLTVMGIDFKPGCTLSAQSSQMIQ